MIPINGTPDNDTLAGTAGDDLILGLAGNDRLNGLAGDDTLDGGAGTNQIDSGDGNDTVVLDGTASSTNVHIPATGIDGGAGTDTISFAGVAADFHIVQIVGGGLDGDGLGQRGAHDRSECRASGVQRHRPVAGPAA
jgi:Ca2+-binding RTX toxin-like protein